MVHSSDRKSILLHSTIVSVLLSLVTNPNLLTWRGIFMFKQLVNIKYRASSAWAKSYRIDTTDAEGNEESYFMKVFKGPQGLGALKGEFESMLAIHAIVGGYIPKPIWWGSFTTVTDAHYYIYKFYELVDELSEPTEFCETVANLHALSESPNGKFGFHTVTYNGNLPQNNDWASTWEEFFTVGFKHMLEINIERGGSWKEMEELRSAIVTKVIPRLLRPLELNGRTVKPSLVHGDLWCGNTALDTMTGKPSVFSLTHYASPFA